jgi:hypothetical protein
MRVSRRHLIFGSAACGLVASALAAPAWQLGAIARVIRTHVPDAKVTEPDLEAFANELVAHEHMLLRPLLAASTLPAPLRNLLPRAAKGYIEKAERIVATNFLLGTDYFDPERKSDLVSFISYPDPYSGGCANPLARLDFPPAAQSPVGA